MSDAAPICVVSDGASISFDSGAWAEIIVRRFVADQNLGESWLTSAINEYQLCYDRESMDWMRQGAFDRGSFATIVGVVAAAGSDIIRVCAIGDSLFVLADGETLVETLPYRTASEFDQSPTLLSTNPIENALLEEVLPDPWQQRSLSGLVAPKIMLMTDALGRWLLEQPDAERMSALLNIADLDKFRLFVCQEQASGRLRRDDTTLVIMERTT